MLTWMSRWIPSICTLHRTSSAREYANRRDPARHPCQHLPKPVTDCHDSETCTGCTNMVQLQVAPSSSNGFLPEARSNERPPIPHHLARHKPERERICSTIAIGGLKKHAHGFSKPTVRESIELLKIDAISKKIHGMKNAKTKTVYLFRKFHEI